MKKATRKAAQKSAVETSSFETTVKVCCHHVAVCYWGFETTLTDELEADLTKEGEHRAQECILQGYCNGELNYLHVDANGKDEEIRGWWEILPD